MLKILIWLFIGNVSDKIIEKITDKILSGRFLLTVTCAIVFAYAVQIKLLDAVAIGVIITGVFKDYFGRSDRKIEENGVPK